MAWYVAHTKSGCEQKVKSSIEHQARTRGYKDKIFRIIVPQEEHLEVVKGSRTAVKHKVFPGYVFIEMVLTDETWALVKNTENVTHFLGTAREPMPIKESEMQTILKRIGLQAEGPVIDLAVGDQVVVLIGPFADFNGIIQDIDYDKQKAKVMLSVFGRETPVELSFNEIEKTSDA
ncbi:transcription termination/antitermination factor NusG [bacterium]|jgi:transcriptional antiterminator NusG|nr:transcription termination/antitermination factor NusG [bacterium]